MWAQQIAAIAPEATTIQPRSLSGIAALVVTGLLLLLYSYRRKLYIVYWIAGWLITAASLLLTAYPYPGKATPYFAFGVSQFLGIIASLVFVVSADAYRAPPKWRPGYGYVLLPLFIWFALAPIPLGPRAVFAPGHLLMAGGLTAAAFAYMVLAWPARMVGAGLIAVGLLASAGTEMWLVFGAQQPDSPEVSRIAFISLVLNLVTALGMQLMTFEDMTAELRSTNRQLEAAEWNLRQMVTTDALTGCRNRRFFDQVIGSELQRHRRYRLPLSIVFVDVDRFKVINDTLGHEAGDRVLQLVAAFLKRNVREADYVFRWGGDEFLVLISCTEADALRKARELQHVFARTEAPQLPDGVGLSIGCAEVPDDASDVMALVKTADDRMYENKRAMRA